MQIIFILLFAHSTKNSEYCTRKKATIISIFAENVVTFQHIDRKNSNMDIQYGIVALILIIAIGYAAWRIYKSIKQNLACKDYHCAGCGLYEKCKKKSKK